MRIEGSARLATPPDRAWQRLTDPEAVRRCAPGLESLEPVGPDRYDAVLDLKLPAIRGRFTGRLEFLDRSPPERLRLRAEARGAPGFANADVELTLAPAGPGTELRYAADLQVGGQLGRLGQRMISGVAKDMASQFFESLDRLDQPGAAPKPAPLRALLDLLWRSLRRLTRL